MRIKNKIKFPYLKVSEAVVFIKVLYKRRQIF